MVDNIFYVRGGCRHYSYDHKKCDDVMFVGTSSPAINLESLDVMHKLGYERDAM